VVGAEGGLADFQGPLMLGAGTVQVTQVCQHGAEVAVPGGHRRGSWGYGVLVEGVADEFMLARMSPVTLPGAVVRDVQQVGDRAAALGPVRFEWPHDGDQAWVVQMHLAQAVSGATIHPGTPSRWRRFHPALGLRSSAS
jgi:hypothetical protein